MEYKNVLLVSEDKVKSESNIDANISGKYLLTAIKLAQDTQLQSTIGTELLESLQKKVINYTADVPVHPIEPEEPYSDSIDDHKNSRYKELLDYYIQPYLIYQVLSEIIIPISYKLSNFGVMRTDDEKAYVADNSKVDLLKQHYNDKADFYKRRLQYYLIDHFNDFPELVEYHSIDKMFPNLYSASNSSLWLGGAIGKTFYPKEGYLRSKYDFPSKNK